MYKASSSFSNQYPNCIRVTLKTLQEAAKNPAWQVEISNYRRAIDGGIFRGIMIGGGPFFLAPFTILLGGYLVNKEPLALLEMRDGSKEVVRLRDMSRETISEWKRYAETNRIPLTSTLRPLRFVPYGVVFVSLGIAILIIFLIYKFIVS